MKDFDPFRLSQQFKPDQVEGNLPHLGVLDWEEEEPPRSFNYKFLWWTAPLILLLLISIWSQVDEHKSIVIHRSIFE